jgi:hypothetical protein
MLSQDKLSYFLSIETTSFRISSHLSIQTNIYGRLEKEKKNERERRTRNMRQMITTRSPLVCVYICIRARAYVCNNNCSMLQIDSDYISITVQPPYREKERREKKREHTFTLFLSYCLGLH